VRFRRPSNACSVPPWNTLQRKAPPGSRTSHANSAAASAKAMTRRWSVRAWPVPCAAMSESTTSARPPRKRARSLAGASRCQNPDAGQRLHGQEVDPHHLPLAFDRAYALGRHLGPATGCRAKIDHPRTWLQHVVPVVDLNQFVGGARAIALPLGRGHVGVIELALEPALGGGRMLACGLQAHLELPSTAPAASAPPRFSHPARSTAANTRSGVRFDSRRPRP